MLGHGLDTGAGPPGLIGTDAGQHAIDHLILGTLDVASSLEDVELPAYVPPSLHHGGPVRKVTGESVLHRDDQDVARCEGIVHPLPLRPVPEPDAGARHVLISEHAARLHA